MENSIVLETRIPKKYKSKLIGEGTSGSCYLTTFGNVYKELNQVGRYLYDQIKDLTNYKSDLIAFPKSLIYYKYESKRGFRGYLMDHFEGVTLDYLEGKIDINVFLDHLYKLEEEIKNISKEGIVLSDINDKNMMYDENGGLKLIDTDLYETQLYKDFDKCYEWNMIELFNAIMDFIFFTKFVYFDNEKLDDLYRYCGYNGKLKPSEFLYEFVEFVNKNRNTNIKTLSNLRNKGYRYFKFR